MKKILEFYDNFNLRIYIIEIHYVIPTLLKRMVTFRKEVGCITEKNITNLEVGLIINIHTIDVSEHANFLEKHKLR